MDLSSHSLWVSIAQIILVDILLGGDNAVVIALACRGLPAHLRQRGVLWGVVGAVGTRIALIAFALQLLGIPYLKIIGAALLLWIGAKLALPTGEEEPGQLNGGTTLWSAVRTVVVADAMMSLDNVVAIAAAANGQLSLVVIGIAVSVPIIVWGSRLVILLLDRWPAIVVFGSALLGWIAGPMALSDVSLHDQVRSWPSWAPTAASAVGALMVLAVAGLSRIREAATRAKSQPIQGEGAAR